MANIKTRQLGVNGVDGVTIKGTPLDAGEHDQNYINLNQELKTAAKWDPTNTKLVDPISGALIEVVDYAATLFANLPNPTTVQPGIPYYVSDVGIGGSQWVSNGVKWNVIGGSVIVAMKTGTIAVPISTITGVTADVFTTDTIKFPANIFTVGVSHVKIEAVFRRTGTNGSGTIRTVFSTDSIPADSEWVYSQTMSAVNLSVLRLSSSFYPGNGTVTMENWSSVNGISTDSVADRASAKFSTTLDQFMKFRLAAANVNDSFSLISYKIEVYP